MAKKKKKLQQVEPPKAMKMPGMLMRENGVIMLSGQFDEETIQPIVQEIIEHNLKDEDDQPEEIKLIINSPGGQVHQCWQLIDTMKMSTIPVRTIGQGLVASCGVLTLMAGDKRAITHNTSVMSHTYSWGSRGKEGELMAIVKEFEYASERMMEHYRKCTKKSKSYIRKNLLHAHDEWMSPEDCVRHGIVDEIWTTY